SYLEANDIHIWLRMHPRFEQTIDKNILSLSNIHLFSSKKYVEINRYLAYFDALITDYSSIYFDFLTLKRPVLFVDYDLERYVQEIGLIDGHASVKCAESTQNMVRFLSELDAIKARSVNLDRQVKIANITSHPTANHEIYDYVIRQLFGTRSEEHTSELQSRE